MPRPTALMMLILLTTMFSWPARSRILWSDPDARTVHYTGDGVDILGGAVKRTSTNNDALFFKFDVDPLSDVASEPYFAGFQLFEGDEERLGVANAMEAWGYSPYLAAETGPSNAVNSGEFNFKSAHPEPANLGVFRPYELVRQEVKKTIVFKVQYVPGGLDVVTVWLDPNLGRGASENNQPEALTTKFKALATFDQIRLRHGKGEKGDGRNGWIFSDMAIATSFDDFVVVHYWQTWWFNTLVAAAVLLAVGATVRIVEKKKFQRRLQRMEQESALERERSRIAQDLHDFDRQGNADQHLETRGRHRSSFADQSGPSTPKPHHHGQRPGIRPQSRHRRRQTQRLRQHAPAHPGHGRQADTDEFARRGHAHGAVGRFSRLTRRAGGLCEFLGQLARGYAYKEIADRMNISIDTVRSYVRTVYERLRVHSRTEAVVKYLQG